MSNQATQYDLTVNADGVYSELQKAQSSFDKYAVAVDLASKKAAVSQEALTEAVKNGASASNNAQRQTTAFMSALVQQASTAGMTRTQLLELKAAQLGVSDSAKAYIDQIKAADAAAQQAGGAHGGAAGITRELIVMGHEAMTGNLSRMPGSFMVLAERINIVSGATKLGTAALEAMGVASVSTAAALGVVLIPLIAIAAAAAAVYEGNKDLKEYASTVAAIATTTGQSSDTVQKFGYTLSTIGVGAEDAGKALESLDKVQNDALHGNGNAQKAFEALGISMSALKQMSPEQVLEATADAFAKTQDGASKTAIAVELFGDSGAKMIPLLDQGSGKLKQLGVDAENYGAVLSGPALDALEAMKRSEQEHAAQMEAVHRAAEAELIPSLVALSSAMASNASLGEAQHDIYIGLGGALKVVATIADTVATGVMQVASTVKGLGVIALDFWNKDFAAMPGDAKKAFDNVKQEGQDFVAFQKKLWADSPVPDMGPPKSGGTLGELDYAHTRNGGQHRQRADANDSLLASLQEQAKAMQEQLDTGGKLTEAEKERLKVKQQISDLEAKRDNGKILSDSEKLVLQDKQALLTQADANVNTAFHIEQLNEINKLKESASKIDGESLAYLKQQNDQYAEQLAAVGRGAQAQKDAQARAAINKQFNGEQSKLDNETPFYEYGSDDYKNATASIAASRDQALKSYDDYTAQLKAKEADWSVGFSQAWANYYDSAQNNLKNASKLFGDVTSDMGDAFANFVTGTKTDFAGMAKSIIADLAKISAEKAIAGFGSAMFGAAGSSGDSGWMGSLMSSFHFATGGAVNGPGTSTSDSIPAMLSDGEYVLKASAVDRIGVQALDALNSGAHIGSVAHYASGGSVGAAAASVASPAVSSTTQVGVTVNAGNSGFDKSDAAWLQKQVQALVDSRLAVKMRGQGGYAWQMKNGSVA